jgi:site-specific recombinase XerD
MLGVSVGGGISELLALTVGDVCQNHLPVGDLLFLKGVVKGRETSRMIPVNADGRKAIGDLIYWHQGQYGDPNPSRPLFPSRKGCGEVAMTRKTGHEVLKAAFETAGLNGKLATHSLRKSFAQRVYDVSGDIYLTQELLGHKDLNTTREYLGVSYQKAQWVVEAIETSNRNRTGVLLHSPDKIPTDALLAELQRRGVDVSITTQMRTQRQGESSVTADDKVIPMP